MRNLPLAAATAALSLVLGARAEIDLKNSDLTVKTEDDFYHHVNGTWLKNNPIPADRSVWASYSEIDERNQTNLRTLCERVAAKTDGAAPVEKMVGDFYASGMNEAVINALGAKPLQPELDGIAAVKTPVDVLKAIAHLQSLGVAVGFAFGSSPDLKQSDRETGRIGQAVDRQEWGMTPPTVNAYYRATNNEIVFPAGILQPPFFDFKADDAVNYGGIGAVIGHEMTHGFDDSGSKYDAHGNLNNWWTEESAKNFKARATAIVKQFAAYEPLPGVHLNGELTQSENIADLGGVKIAYYALQKALPDKPRDPVNGFTPEQRFFLNYATIWRDQMRPEEARRRVNIDPHSPGQFRANGPLSNLDEFAKAFSIPDESPMRRSPETRVTIW
jgi:predicted metalloendopeptidase